MGRRTMAVVWCVAASLLLTACPPANTTPVDPIDAAVASGLLEPGVATAVDSGPVDVLISFTSDAAAIAGAGAASGSADPTASYIDRTTALYEDFKNALLTASGLGTGAVLKRYDRLPELFVRVQTRSQLAATVAFKLSQPTGSGSVQSKVTRVAFSRDVSFESVTQARSLIGADRLPAVAPGQPSDGTGMSIAVIDSGYDSVAVNTVFGVHPNVTISPVGVDSGDDTCHGSLVNYIASQIAPGAHIISYDVSSTEGNCFSPRIDEAKGEQLVVDALNDIVSKRRGGEPIVAVNMSLALRSGNCANITSTDPFGVIFDQMRLLGIVPVVASGNGGQVTNFYPSCASAGAIRVGSVWDQTATLSNLVFPACGSTSLAIVAGQLSCYSNRLTDDILAPGGPYLEASGNPLANFVMGTSFAAPVVAGAIAVLKQRHPTLAADAVVAAIRDSGPLVNDSRSSRVFHRLDLVAADAEAATLVATTNTDVELGRGAAFIPNSTGYLTIDGTGHVVRSVTGGAQAVGDPSPTGGTFVAIIPTRSAGQYWAVDDLGHVVSVNSAPSVRDAFRLADGTARTVNHTSPISAADVYYDSTGSPQVVMATKTGELLPTGVVDSTGQAAGGDLVRNRVGDADLGTTPLDGDVVALDVTTDGRGAWVTTASGTVHSFGTAAAFAAPVDFRPTAPVIAMRAAPDGSGYYVLTEDGRLASFSADGRSPSPRLFGDAADRLSSYSVSNRAASLQERAVALSVDGDQRGYRILTCTGRMIAVSLDQNNVAQTTVTAPTQTSCTAPGPLGWRGHLHVPGPGSPFPPGATDGPLGDPSISADGQRVAFASTATNLVSGDDDGRLDVFVWDRSTGVMRRQPTPNGTPDGPSGAPSISPDGRYVVFTSYATNLAANDINDTADLFLWDTVTGSVTRIQRGTTQPNARVGAGSVSAGGAYVAFSSAATNLVDGDTNGAVDVYRWNRATGQVVRAQRASAEPNASSGPPNLSDGPSPAISSDGRFVAFETEASNIASADTNAVSDVVRWDATDGSVRRAVGATGLQLVDAASSPTMSADGTRVAFDEATGSGPRHRVWFIDLNVGSPASSGVTPRVSGDGTVVSSVTNDGAVVATTVGASEVLAGRLQSFAARPSSTGRFLVEESADSATGVPNLWVVDREQRTAIRVGDPLVGTAADCTNRGPGADLHGCDLTGTDFWGDDLTGANLRGANLSGTRLVGVQSGGADFSGANLRGATLGRILFGPIGGGTFTDASFRFADLTNIEVIASTSMGSADFGGADLTGGTYPSPFSGQGLFVFGARWWNTRCANGVLQSTPCVVG